MTFALVDSVLNCSKQMSSLTKKMSNKDFVFYSAYTFLSPCREDFFKYDFEYYNFLQSLVGHHL